MEEHYRLIFNEDPIQVTNIKNNLPEDLLYPLKSAQSVIDYRFTKARIISQQLSFDEHYAIESFQLDSSVPLTIEYELFDNRQLIVFVMHNTINFKGCGGLITTGNDFTYFMAGQKKGLYEVECNSGTTVLVVISLVTNWLLKATQNFKMLFTSVQQFLDSDMHYDVLPACPIDDQIFNWLLKAREYDYNNDLARENFISIHIIMGLGYYEQQLHFTNGAQIYDIKKYIESQFDDTTLTVNRIYEQSNLPAHTLRRKFKKSYGCSIRSYCLNFRMLKAKQYIEINEIPVKEVWKKVGFKEENEFRKAYRKSLLISKMNN